MGDTIPLEDPGALEPDVLGIKAVEETAPLAEEHRDEMDLELVEDAGSECQLRRFRRRGPARSCRPQPAWPRSSPS